MFFEERIINMGEDTQKAFAKVKELLCVAVLALPDFSQPVEVECHVSGIRIGAVLIQAKLPIAYFS